MNKDILSIDYDDDNKDITAFNKYLETDLIRKKNQTAFEIEKMGNLYLKEIDKKRKQKEHKKTKLIPYIIKHSKGMYDIEELNSYSFEDIRDIHNKIKKESLSSISKFFHFIFNVN